MLLFAALFGPIGCDDHAGEDGWYDCIPGGGAFFRANTVRFYYLDADGNGLIDPADPATWPVTTDDPEADPATLRPAAGSAPGLYHGNCCGIHYDEAEDLYYFSTFLYGDESKSSYTFRCHCFGGVDEMEVTYKYTDRDVDGGGYWAKVVSWKYNGRHIYSDDDANSKKIFVRKEGGRTEIAFRR